MCIVRVKKWKALLEKNGKSYFLITMNLQMDVWCLGQTRRNIAPPDEANILGFSDDLDVVVTALCGKRKNYCHRSYPDGQILDEKREIVSGE